MSRGLGVTEALRSGLPEWTLEAFTVLSLFGDLLVIGPALVALYAADVWRTLSREGPDRPLCSDRTALLVAVVLGGLALIVLLKEAFAAPRPPAELHAIEPSEHGFPSGHTMAATVFWGALVLWSTIGRRSSRFAVGAAVVALVGLSRLALGVHYLVDVLASVALGALYLAGVVRLGRGSPARAFAASIAIAVAAVVVTGGGGRAILALLGTCGGAVGWWFLERPPVRRGLFRATPWLRGE